MDQIRETERLAELSKILPDTDEFGREIAVPDVEAYRQEQKLKQQQTSEASEAAESVAEGSATPVDQGDSEATAGDQDNTGNDQQTTSAEAGEDPTREQVAAGGDDADEQQAAATDVSESQTAVQDKKGGEQGQEDETTGASTAGEPSNPTVAPLQKKVVTEVPPSISKELAAPQPKPTGPVFFLSTLVDAKAFAAPVSVSGPGSKAKLPVAGLYSIRRMLGYSTADTAEKTMEVRPSQHPVLDQAALLASLLVCVRVCRRCALCLLRTQVSLLAEVFREMLTRDAAVVLREAMQKAAVRIREEKLEQQRKAEEEQKRKQEQQKKEEEQTQKEKEKLDRERAETADESKPEQANADDEAAGNAAGSGADSAGDVDAFDDLMIGKTYTDDEDTPAPGAVDKGDDCGDGGDGGDASTAPLVANNDTVESAGMETEDAQSVDRKDGGNKRKREMEGKDDSTEARAATPPAKKQATCLDGTSMADVAAQPQQEKAPCADSESSSIEAADREGAVQSQSDSESNPSEDSVRLAFHFLDRGNGKAAASPQIRGSRSHAGGGAGEPSPPLRGYITGADLQTLL